MAFLAFAIAEVKVAWLWGYLQLAPILTFSSSWLKRGFFFYSTALIRDGKWAWQLSFRGKLETVLWPQGFWWVCPCHQKWLVQVHSCTENQARHTLMAFSVLPGWVARVPCTWSPYSCLSSGWVSLALAEVHLFMLFTNPQRNFTGRGRVESK